MTKNRSWTAISKALSVMTVTLIMALILAPGARAAGNYKTLHKFTGGADGNQPADTLVFDASGNLYGTAIEGGSSGAGTVFELTPNADGDWTLSVLYGFTGGSDGRAPLAEVIFDAKGNLYGTSLEGGDYGAGTVFEVTPNSDGSWTESVLYSFTGGSDGAYVVSGLVFDAACNLYGTATKGGAYEHGVVFKLAPNSDGSWTESVLHAFMGGKDGGYPDHGHLIFDAAGNLYGTTAGWYGGGYGTVFELTPNSNGTWTESVLHSFFGGEDGMEPEGTLIFDLTGSLYGTTAGGGAYGHGTAFRLAPGLDGKWKKDVLHQFRGGNDGSSPFSGVVFDTAGNLYGTTDDGGAGSCSDPYGTGCGTVFELIPNSKGGWTEQVLRRFAGITAGNPFGGVVLDTAGNLYGTTYNSSFNSLGVVFEITP